MKNEMKTLEMACLLRPSPAPSHLRAVYFLPFAWTALPKTPLQLIHSHAFAQVFLMKAGSAHLFDVANCLSAFAEHLLSNLL